MQMLMCEPAYYGIEYEINPWMSRARQSNRAVAEEQWQRLRGVLVDELGVKISLIRPEAGLPDMVFTANAGLVWKNKFIVSNFRYPARQGEAPHYAKWFGERGYEIVHLPAEYNFEGEGDLLRCGALWFAGYHIRSDVMAHQRVAAVVEDEILSLELTNDWFYHLDTCFCPLAEGQALYYPAAFDEYALRVLQQHIPTLIAVDKVEADRFACNAVVAGNKIVLNTGCPKIRRHLEELGFTVFETPLDEFIKAGGSAKCLTLIIGDR